MRIDLEEDGKLVKRLRLKKALSEQCRHDTPGRHTFDLVAKDASGKTLAVEMKFVAAKGGRMPNGEIQRLMGQCTLAKTKHQFVIGVCGYRGTLDHRWDNDTQAVRSWSEQAGISLIFRAVG